MVDPGFEPRPQAVNVCNTQMLALTEAVKASGTTFSLYNLRPNHTGLYFLLPTDGCFYNIPHYLLHPPRKQLGWLYASWRPTGLPRLPGRVSPQFNGTRAFVWFLNTPLLLPADTSVEITSKNNILLRTICWQTQRKKHYLTETPEWCKDTNEPF